MNLIKQTSPPILSYLGSQTWKVRVNRRVAEGSLKKFGASVECAASGKAALESLEILHVFDAYFMDVQMSEMDGFEATRRIQEMEYYANECMSARATGDGSAGRGGEWHLPILAMAADVIHATYEKCLASGMDGYVSKPFEEENLYQALAKFFQSKPTPGPWCEARLTSEPMPVWIPSVLEAAKVPAVFSPRLVYFVPRG